MSKIVGNYLVWNQNSGYAKHVHYSESNANEEAERLARNHPGQRFCVLFILFSCIKNDILWEKADPKNNIDDSSVPF
jgi:hypothetical protein